MNDPLINIKTNKDEELNNNNNSFNKVNTFYLKYYPCKKSEVLVRRFSLYVLANTFIPPNNHDFASLRRCSFTRNHAK